MENFLQFLVGEEEKSYLCFIEGDEDKIMIFIIEDKTEKMILNLKIDDFEELLPFFDNSKKYKAVILDVFYCRLFSPYQNNHEFCVALKAKFMEAQIPAFFICKDDLMFCRILMIKNYKSKIDEFVSFMIPSGDKGFTTNYKFTKNGFTKLPPYQFTITSNITDIQNHALQYHPKTVILMDVGDCDPKNIDLLKAALSKTSKISLINFAQSNFTHESWIKSLKNIVDEQDIQYQFIQGSFRKYIIRPRTGACKCPIICVNAEETLPVEVSKMCAKLVHDIIVTSEDTSSHGEVATLFTATPDAKAHQHEVILKIDKEDFASYEIKPVILDQIENLPKFLKKKKDLQIPVIGFLQNLSFICVRKNNQTGYEFLQSWNGIYGTNLYLNFDHEKPSFGDKAFKAVHTNSNGLVYDLMNIMAIPADKLKTYCEHFKITKDDKNPVLIEIKNYKGEEKVATPAFLMALMLKEHFKAIKEELGEKPSEVAIVLFDEFFKEFKENVKTQITESCKMLKVDCSFIEI